MMQRYPLSLADGIDNRIWKVVPITPVGRLMRIDCKLLNPKPDTIRPEKLDIPPFLSLVKIGRKGELIPNSHRWEHSERLQR